MHATGSSRLDPRARRQSARTVVVAAVALVAILAACTPLPPPPGAAPVRYRDLVFASASVTSNLAYGAAVNQQGVNQTLSLDLYTPAGDTVTSRPALVWVHGGAFVVGSKSGALEQDVGTTFARKGYVVASIQYRLAPPGGGCSFAAPSLSCVQAIVDARHDALAAIRWVRANASTLGVDPDRIAIAGASAGGITALNAVGWDLSDAGTSGTPGVSSRAAAAISVSGTAIPTNALNAGDAPALLIHGTSDLVVPYTLAQQTTQAAAASGGFALLLTLDGAGHVPWTQHRTAIVNEMTSFLWWMLRPAG